MSLLLGPRCLGRLHLLSKALPEALKNLALRLADGLAEAGSAAFQSDSCRPNFGFALAYYIVYISTL